jgi:ribose transport system substrate-binding protein
MNNRTANAALRSIVSAAALLLMGQAAMAQDAVKIEDYLVPPSNAQVIEPVANPELVADPITREKIALPYADAFPVPEGTIGDASKQYTVCFSQALIRHPFPVSQRASMMIEEAKHPNLKVLYYNTDNDPLKQIQDLQTCVAQKPDAILVWPHSVAPLTPAIKKVHDAGNIVIGMERSVATDDYTSWIYLDDSAETSMLAEAIAAQLGGKGKIAETSGAIGSSPQIIRNYGFTKALKKIAPEIEIVTTTPTDYSEAQGFSVALQFLGSPAAADIKAWFVHSGAIALGMEKAMKQLGHDIPIYTIDGSKREVQAVIDGRITAIAPHNPLHGDVALRMAIWAIEGKEIPKDVKLAPAPLITKDNAAAALDAAWGSMK